MENENILNIEKDTSVDSNYTYYDTKTKQLGYDPGFFGFFKSNLIGKPLKMFDWIAFLIIAAFCIIAYCHQDIFHTASSSFSYITGHFLDFYDYNVAKNVEPMNNYMPSTYLLFAVWNLPLFILGIKRVPWGGSPFIAVIWYKLLPIIFFLGCGIILYRIGVLIGFGEKKSKILTYTFLTCPIAFFGPFIMGQYDSFTVFFILMGLFYYLKNEKNDDIKFILFFAIAITFKYFALLIFLPLLLLKEKNVLQIFKNCALVSVPFILECLFYIKSPMFHKGVFNFVAKDNLFTAGTNLGFASFSWFLIIWVILLGWAYYKDTSTLSKDSFVNWSIYFSNFIICVVFAICVWHPQWLLIATPFIILSSFLNKNPKMFFLIDIFMFIVFVIFSAQAWIDGIDQHMLSKGIFKKFMSPIDCNYGIPVSMCSFLNFGGINFHFSLLSGLFLINLILKHPKFCVEKINCSFEKIVSCWTIVRMRLFTIVSAWVIPTLFCLIVSIFSPSFILKNSQSFRGEMFGPGLKNAMATQIYVPNENFEISQLQILLMNSGEIPIEVNRNTRVSTSKIVISMFKEDDGKNLLNKTYHVKLPNSRPRPITFKIDNTKLEAGKRYKVSVNLADEFGRCVAYIGKTIGGFNDKNHAVIDGHMQGYSYCIDFLGKKL